MMNSKFTSHLASLAVAALSGLLLMTACEKENEKTVTIPEGALLISAESTHSSNSSKTTVDGTAVYWYDGDAINVNGTEGTVLFSEGAAYLSGINNSVDMYAGFPAEITSVSGTNITLNIPNSYSYDEREGNQKLDLPMVAYAEANSTRLDFKHVCAAIQVNVNNVFSGAEFYLEKITVSSNSHPLCGTVTVSPNPLGVSHIPTYSASTASVTMNFGDEEVSVAASGSKSIQIPVLLTLGSSTISVDIEGHYANGADFSSGRVDAAAKIVYHNSSSTLLERAKVYPAPCTIRVSGSPAITKTYPKFSVSSTKKVYFSRGNLQYQASSGQWRFAPSQNNYIGANNSNISSSYTGWIDFFGFGTSGKSTGATANQPYASSTNAADYYGSDLTYNASTGADWGSNNYYGTAWRTLGTGEITYLLFTRSSGTTVNGTANARYTLARVNGTNGLLIFPDNTTIPTFTNGSTWGTINNASTTWSTTITSADWDKLERAGCIFLPAAGSRGNDSDGTIVLNAGGVGCYWTAKASTDNKAYRFNFTLGSNAPGSGPLKACRGYSVRLVQDAN